MTIKITYMVHGTTFDNEKDLMSGQNEVDLSPTGIEQAEGLGKLRHDSFDVIFTSDLKRAIDTAELAFKGRCPIIQDARLRECNFGDLTQKPKKEVNLKDFIKKPYPNGESYEEAQRRIFSFLQFLKENYDNKHIAIVAHQMPQLALNVLLKGMTWEKAIDSDWRKIPKWQPGWEYELK